MRLALVVAVGQLVVSSVSAFNTPRSFELSTVVRNIELAGSSAHVTTAYTARSLSKNNDVFYFSIPRRQDEHTSWIEAKLKGSANPLAVDKHGIAALLASTDPAVYYSVALPKALGVNDTISLIISSIESHPSYPLPAVAKQTEGQSLLYETEAYVVSPYTTLSQRTKIKAPSPNIHSYSNPDALTKYTTDAPVTKSGASVTYGPYHDVPPSDGRNFATKSQEIVKVHYQYDSPVLTIPKLRRAAEISHWGSNLNIQDDIHLKNDGSRLDGHFSRLTHQQLSLYQRKPSSAMLGFSVDLPSGARDVYFTDIVGNVSTSRFRPSPQSPATQSKIKSSSKSSRASPPSILEVKPRYPLLGGWNYTFTLGWDAPLEDSARYDSKTGEYVVAIPFFTHLPGSVVDDAEVKIILPEGATDVQLVTPFPVDSILRDTHITYLDTKGRPSLTLTKKGLTEKHTGNVFISYKVSTSSHMTKVGAVSIAFGLLFALMYGVRRVDTRLTKSA